MRRKRLQAEYCLVADITCLVSQVRRSTTRCSHCLPQLRSVDVVPVLEDELEQSFARRIKCDCALQAAQCKRIFVKSAFRTCADRRRARNSNRKSPTNVCTVDHQMIQ
eukprot:4117823-Pleurochrysis_carterae.AAC.6